MVLRLDNNPSFRSVSGLDSEQEVRKSNPEGMPAATNPQTAPESTSIAAD
ncbi:hypothetical protein L0222_26270 [bacterium]|nr:hypothetical protein [bacterium]